MTWTWSWEAVASMAGAFVALVLGGIAIRQSRSAQKVSGEANTIASRANQIASRAAEVNIREERRRLEKSDVRWMIQFSEGTRTFQIRNVGQDDAHGVALEIGVRMSSWQPRSPATPITLKRDTVPPGASIDQPYSNDIEAELRLRLDKLERERTVSSDTMRFNMHVVARLWWRTSEGTLREAQEEATISYKYR